jgi:flagellar M-ring protein FliF
MTATLREPMLLPSGSSTPTMTALFDEQDQQMEDAHNELAPKLPRAKTRSHQLQQGIFEQVSEHIRREPAQSTRLIEAWIGSSQEVL